MKEVVVRSEDLAAQASCLRSLLRSEDRALALLANNGITALVARRLANDLGLALVPINPLLAANEIAYILTKANCSDLLVESELATMAEQAFALMDEQTPRLHISSAPSLAEETPLHYLGSTASNFAESDIGATLIFTSGTTGKPKGCMRSASQEYARARELIATYSLTSNDRQLVACPLAHSAPGIFVRAAHAAGASSIIMRRFRPPSFWAACNELGATFFFLVPTQYRRLLETCHAQHVPSHLRATIVAGAPLFAPLHRRIIDWLGPNRLWQFYGSSETGTIAIAAPSALVNDSVGVLAPCVELEIRDEEGKVCESGSIGEMFIRSPTVMSGYQGESQGLPADGFISVGDLGYQDESGQLFLVDRKHDTIISGGVNVYPAEVEAALLRHSLVQAAVVVGMDDQDWGQRVVALVAADSTCSEQELMDHCDANLARYKKPKEIHFFALDKMPVGASGKPLRRSARAMLL